MIKNSELTFHETFQPEITYISKIMELASNDFVGSKFDISDATGIPTGKQKGKVEPHIKYAKFMGLINFMYSKGIYSLTLTNIGKEVILQDPYLHDDLTCWICHYFMARKKLGAPQWSYLIHDAHPGFGESISQEKVYINATRWCDETLDNMSKRVFSPVKSSYTDGFFEKLNFLQWNDYIEFNEQHENFDLIFLYALALIDSWNIVFPDKPEITIYELKDELGFDKIFGFNEEECNYVIDSMAYEGVIKVNRQLFPPTIIRTSNIDNIVSELYSRLL